MTALQPTKTASYHLGLVLITCSAIAWSTAGLFTRLIPLDVWTMLIWRGLFGALGLLILIIASNGRAGLSGFARLGWPGWAFAGISAIGMLCFITALRLTTVAHVAVIYATIPFVAAALGWIVLRERPGRSALSASACAVIGVAVMVGFGRQGDLRGDLLGFGMTLAMAVLLILSRRYRDIPILPAACLSALLSAAIAVPLAPAIGVETKHLGLLAAFGLVNSAVGLGLFSLGARMLPAIETALIGALDAPLAPIWVWLVFAETPGRATLIGAAIVFASVTWHIIRQNRRQQPNTD